MVGNREKVKTFVVGVLVGSVVVILLTRSCEVPWDEDEAERLEQEVERLRTQFEADTTEAARILADRDRLMQDVQAANQAAAEADERADRADRRFHALAREASERPDGPTRADIDAITTAHEETVREKDIEISELRSNVDRLTDLNQQIASHLRVVIESSGSQIVELRNQVSFWQEAAKEAASRGLIRFRVLGLNVRCGPGIGGGISLRTGKPDGNAGLVCGG